jgi:hypothetical protein
LRIANCELRIANCELRIANCELRIANCELRIARSIVRLLSTTCKPAYLHACVVRRQSSVVSPPSPLPKPSSQVAGAHRRLWLDAKQGEDEGGDVHGAQLIGQDEIGGRAGHDQRRE